MGKDWEKQQLDKLIGQQQVRIEKIKKYVCGCASGIS